MTKNGKRPAVKLSARRLRALLAAESFAQRARLSFCAAGVVGAECWPWFDRWARLAGKRAAYAVPDMPAPVWCGSCRRRHVAGQHVRAMGQP